jgi:myo-inositol-1-phosphate synthase
MSLDKTWFDGAVEKFFGSPPFKLHRKDAEVTSVEAAHAIDTKKMEQTVYEAIKGFPNGCISDEILEMYPDYPYSSITARYRALLDKGYIEIIGTRVGRSGRNQRIMKVKL